MVPPSTEKVALLRSASVRRWSLTTRSLSMLPRFKEESVDSCENKSLKRARQRPRRARTYNVSVQTSSGPRLSHGNQSHFPHYVRESGQGLRGLCSQGQPRRAVWIYRGRGTAFWRAFLGGARPHGGTHQGGIFRRQAHLSAHAFDPAHR